MVYSALMKKALGLVRYTLDDAGLGLQDSRFSRHGNHEPDPDAPLVLVACSGGRDSLALAAVTRIVAASRGLRCGAVIVDHQLQEGSAEVASQAARTCTELGLSPVNVVPVSVTATGQGTEAAARQARYTALDQTSVRLGAAAVFLAHTQDDQVETVLLSLLRGSSPTAMTGMPRTTVRSGVLFARPFLDLKRRETTSLCEQNGLTWWDDPTNAEYLGEVALSNTALPLRSRVRKLLVPIFRELGGEASIEHIATVADSLRQDAEYLDTQAAAALEAARLPGKTAPDAAALVRLDTDVLSGLHPAIRTRVLAQAVSETGHPATRAHIEALDALVTNWHGQAEVRISRGFWGRRHQHVIELCQDGGHANS